MKTLHSQVGGQHPGLEHYVIDLTDEPVCIDFVRQVDDLIVSSPDGDILVSWDIDPESFTQYNCLLLQVKDNMKELPVARCTRFYMMTKEKGKTLRVYVTGQRN